MVAIWTKIPWRKSLLTLVGVLVCLFSLRVLWYVQALPDVGLRFAFSRDIKLIHEGYLRSPESSRPIPHPGDEILRVGDDEVLTWARLLRALSALDTWQPVEVNDLLAAERDGLTFVQHEGEKKVLLQFRRFEARTGQVTTFAHWFLVGRLPLQEMVPSLLWFFLKLGLFVVGVLVFWKRPGDRSAAQFYLLCVVTLGAYMGGYHWSRIATARTLVVGFMFCSVLLPAVLLHFYLLFPRPKGFLERRPGWALAAIYGPLVLLLALLIGCYAHFVWVSRRHSPAEEELAAQQWFMEVIYVIFGVAAAWYVASVACLIHSYRAAADGTERNQVKWILFGSLIALMPIGYSLYLVGWEQDDFGAGAATWPMFAASFCFTAAFAVSITRYRLMQLDQIVTSGVVYFLISFGAGAVYYAGVFAGTLVGGQVFGRPSLPQALWASSTALILLIVLDLARSRVKKALDRRFSRQKHQLDRTLQSMGQAIEKLVDPPTLAGRLLKASADLLNVSRGAVYLREREAPLYRLAGSLGPTPALTELSPGCPLVEALQDHGNLVLETTPGRTPDAARRQLRFLGGEMAQALAHEGQLLALLVLGPKDLGAYSAEDLNLLAAFAQLTALALESAERHQTIESLNRDLRAKVEKISEQQRRILALQAQVQRGGRGDGREGADAGEPAPPGSGSLTPPPPAAPLAGATAILGGSPAIRNLLHQVRKVSSSQSAVVIRGESGTGKELLARALHENSPRAGKAFVKVHCAALSPGLLESELFGHVKGAFTGAHRDKVGRFEAAHGGTLFLDEIGDINLEVQTKLLRVLQEGTFERVGSSEPLAVDVRVISATHQELESLIRQGRFREDLFYRLNVIAVRVPPLRERKEDIPELVRHFLRQYGQRKGDAAIQMEDDVLVALKSYAWPGNIRELENVIERAVVVAEGPAVTLQDLPPELLSVVEAEAPPPWAPDDPFPGPKGVRAEREERDRRERERLVRALAAAGGNKAQAARALGLARGTLLSRLKKYGLS